MPAPQVVTYSVQRGDNLTTIAVHYGVTPAALATLNGITRPSLIQVGKVLKIPVPAPATVETLLEKYAATYKVEAALIKALAWQESGWQQQVISDVGAVGVMQLMPETGRFTGDSILQRAVDTADLEHNVEAGVAFFAYLVRQAKGDVQLAVAGYYQGLRSVVQKGMQADFTNPVNNHLLFKAGMSRTDSQNPYHLVRGLFKNSAAANPAWSARYFNGMTPTCPPPHVRRACLRRTAACLLATKA